MIVLKNGDDIQAKVLEVGQDEIKYKKQSNPDGPTYTIDKDFVFFVKYANGDKDMFSDEPQPKPTVAPAPAEEVKKEEKEKRPVKKGHFITAYGGASFPLEAFASTTAGNTRAGFATTGYHAAVQGAYFIIPYVGVGATVGFLGNSFDTDNYNSAIVQNAGLNINNISVPVKSSASDWNNLYFTFQPHFQYPTKVVNIALSGHVGGMYINTPGIDVTYGYLSEFYKVRVVPKTAVAFTYGGGIDFRFRVSDWVSISVGGNFITADAEIDYQYNYTRTSPSYAYQEVESKGDVRVMVVTASAGITINLDNAKK